MSADDGAPSERDRRKKKRSKRASKKKATHARAENDRARAKKPDRASPSGKAAFLRAMSDRARAKKPGKPARRSLWETTRNVVIAVTVAAATVGGALGGSLDAAIALAMAVGLIGLMAIAIAQVLEGRGEIVATERPAFAKHWPRDERLDALIAAFEAGNFARVRSEAPALAKSSDDEAIKAAAFELRRRIEPGPGALYLWALGVMLVVFLYGYFHAH